MRPAKTDQAREALRTRSGGLGAIERRVLIVSNGERTRDEILSMLGSGAHAALDRLYRDGFLRDADIQVAPERVFVAGEPAAATPAQAAAPGTAASRRSVAAARLYMLDMLQLQRGTEADAIRVALTGSREPTEVACHLAAALDHLRHVAAPSYTARVAARLAEVAPPDLLALIDGYATHAGDVRAA